MSPVEWAAASLVLAAAIGLWAYLYLRMRRNPQYSPEEIRTLADEFTETGQAVLDYLDRHPPQWRHIPAHEPTEVLYQRDYGGTT